MRANRSLPMQNVARSKILAIAAILLLALSLRLVHLGDDPLWYDEICSLESSTGHGYQASILPTNQLIAQLPDIVHLSNAKSVWQIWAHAMDHDAHPPLYYIILRVWREALGTTESTVRMPGVVASLAGIALCAAVGSQLFDDVAGYWAAALMAVSAPQIYFTHEARSYTLFPTFCLLAAYALLRLERFNCSRAADDLPVLRRWAILLGLSSIAAMLTHYYAALPLLAIAGYALFCLRGPARRWAVGSLLSAGVLFALFWGPHILRQQAVFIANKIGAEERGNAGAAWVIEHLPLAAVRELLGTDITSDELALGMASIVACIEIISLVFALRRKDSHLLFCHAWMLIALAALGVLDFNRGTEFLRLMRYLMPAAPAVFLLIPAIGRGHRLARHILPAVALCFCIMGWPRAYASWKGEWREYARDLAAAHHPGDCFVFLSSNSVTPDYGAFGTQYYLPHFRGPAVFLTRPANAQLLQQLENAPSIWIIAEAGVSPEEQHTFLPINGVAQFHHYLGVGDVWHIIPRRT